jgi:hypothetical protein
VQASSFDIFNHRLFYFIIFLIRSILEQYRTNEGLPPFASFRLFVRDIHEEFLVSDTCNKLWLKFNNNGSGSNRISAVYVTGNISQELF